MEGHRLGWPLPLAILFGLAGAALVGLIDGAITVTTGVPSFITTLGMLFFLQGFTVPLSQGYPKPAPTARWPTGSAAPTTPDSCGPSCSQ